MLIFLLDKKMLQAVFFDGNSSRAQSVWVTVSESVLEVNVAGKLQRYHLSEIAVQAKLGATKRLIDLPNGARLEADDISEIEAAIPSKSAVFWTVLHYLENHLGWVIISLCITVLVGWMFIQYGIPKLAAVVAEATPPSMEKKLGEQVLKGLDHKLGYFSASKTSYKQQQGIEASLIDLCKSNDCPEYQLAFRDGGVIGANAFALPGGIMVVTDDLVKLAKNNTEIVAVLAHELGHVKKRHAFRQSIQGTLSGLILAAATGDVSSMASGLPAVLVQMQYSRQHELEADGFALQAMQNSCLPPKAFAEILFRLQNKIHEKASNGQSNKKADKSDAGRYDAISDMLSTHPNTIERIKPFLEAKPAC
jgi:Zn-dependent protease with chaperone function